MNSTTAPNAGFALPRNAPAAARSTLQLLQRLRHGICGNRQRCALEQVHGMAQRCQR